MTTHVDEYRARLIEEVRRLQAQEEVRQMTDAKLLQVICFQLGLPAGTPFTDEQLEMIANFKGQEQRPNHSKGKNSTAIDKR